MGARSISVDMWLPKCRSPAPHLLQARQPAAKRRTASGGGGVVFSLGWLALVCACGSIINAAAQSTWRRLGFCGMALVRANAPFLAFSLRRDNNALVGFVYIKRRMPPNLGSAAISRQHSVITLSRQHAW